MYDYPQYQAAEKQGFIDQTAFQVENRVAPGKNWATRVAKTEAWDDPLLDQDNATSQLPPDQLYPVTPKGANLPAASPSFNGFNWGGVWTI